MSKIYIGVDIGSNGGLAIMESGKVTTIKIPESFRSFRNILSEYSGKEIMAVCEKIHSRPTNGAKVNFSLGRNVERTYNAFEVAKIPLIEVTPQTWMKFFYMKKEKTETQTQWKNRLKDKAQGLFPSVKVTLWNADALLMLFYLTNKQLKE